MTRENRHRGPIDVEVAEEGVEVCYRAAAERDVAVAALDQPWVGDEGPMEAEFRQVIEPEALRPRGLAFDQEATVYWDEDAVMEVRKASTREGELAFITPVLVRDRFASAAGLELCRIDVVKEGALRASRYLWRPPKEGESHA